MNIYEVKTMGQRIKGNRYPGRGVVIGKTADGKHAAFAYFIMGRSANSRNRIFVKKGGDLFTEPFDPAKVADPSLIIYAAVREMENALIVTNGDQTDTIKEGVEKGLTFSKSLESRCFEPDGSNFTPRISGMATFADGDFTYEMSILKSADEKGTACNRYTYSYAPLAGLGHFIHTYVCDGDPIPTFQGEPERIAVPDGIDLFTNDIWENLDEENKISLYVRYVDLTDGSIQERLINKNQ